MSNEFINFLDPKIRTQEPTNGCHYCDYYDCGCNWLELNDWIEQTGCCSPYRLCDE